MSPDRVHQRRLDFRKVVERLAEAVAAPESDLVRDAAIQRFEFSFELAWKSLKDYLEKQGVDAPNPRAALRQGFSQGLIRTEGEADLWMTMLEDRNLSSHTYRQELAVAIFSRIKQDYLGLLRALAGKLDHAGP